MNSFLFCPKRILLLLLITGATKSSFGQGIAQRIYNFGCYLAYPRSTNDWLNWFENNPYGKPLGPLEFLTQDSFDKFSTKVGEILESSMKSFVQNDWDAFLGFINQYIDEQSRGVGQKSLEQFYRGYQAKRPDWYFDYDAAGFVMKIYNEIKALNSTKIENHFYLVKAYVDLPEDPKEKPLNWFQQHVAGAMKIRIAGRPGLMLLDPALGLPKPVILMDDLRPPHQAKVDGGQNYNFHFRRVPKKPLISAEYQNSADVTTYRLYDIEKPYCALKESLLFVDHKIVLRDSNGFPRAYVAFQLKGRHGDDLQFTMGYLDDKSKELVEFGVNKKASTMKRVEINVMKYPKRIKYEDDTRIQKVTSLIEPVIKRSVGQLNSIHAMKQSDYDIPDILELMNHIRELLDSTLLQELLNLQARILQQRREALVMRKPLTLSSAYYPEYPDPRYSVMRVDSYRLPYQVED